MLNALKNEINITYTENGAVTYRCTKSDCLDFFATAGALRKAEQAEIISRFDRAYAENPDIAMKTLFFARDVRGGLGERRLFRVIMKHLADSYPESVKKNIEYIAEYGRFDDLLSIIDTACETDAVSYIRKQMEKDLSNLNQGKSISLLAKWMPSVNASSCGTVRMANKLARAMNIKPAEYRKILSALRAELKILGNNLREKDYTFDYSKQPSKAMFKYRAAFRRNDGQRYSEFLQNVSKGEVKLHADTIMPYELVDPYLCEHWSSERSFMRDISKEEQAALNATWNALPDFSSDENAIAVVDTSASMYCYHNPSPASVALSLGLYFAERNKGLFHNHFIEFSSRPQLFEIKGEPFADRLRYIASFNEVADTNIEAVFKLILDAAVKNNISQREMPSTLYIISDMEFNSCVRNAAATNFQNAKTMYESAGYKLPKVVFWNVASRNMQQPVTMNEQGVALVSGCTPVLFSKVLSGDTEPYSFMMDIINSDRYAAIAA